MMSDFCYLLTAAIGFHVIEEDNSVSVTIIFVRHVHMWIFFFVPTIIDHEDFQYEDIQFEQDEFIF